MKNTTFAVRPAGKEDWGTIADVIWKTWIDAYSSFIPADDLRSYHAAFYSPDALAKLYADPNVTSFVAESDGDIVGVMRTRLNIEEGRYYVSSLYVLPKFQGSGIGRALMRIAADQAAEFGKDRVWLGVMVKNIPAVEWYTAMGFRIAETAPFKMGNTTVDHYIGYLAIEDVKARTKPPTD